MAMPLQTSLSLRPGPSQEVDTVQRFRLSVVAEEATPYKDVQIESMQSAATWVHELIGDRPQEHFIAIFTNARNHVVGWSIINIGEANRSLVDRRSLFQQALLSNAVGLLVAHNHPSGDSTPSPEDRRLTRRLVEGCKLLGIRFVDHLVVGSGGSWTSLRNDGAF